MHLLRFSGYAARPLKALYTMPTCREDFRLLQQLHAIGREEGFGVYGKVGQYLAEPDGPDSLRLLEKPPWLEATAKQVSTSIGTALDWLVNQKVNGDLHNKWAQDKQVIRGNKLISRTENGLQLAKILGLDPVPAQSYNDGGNTFLFRFPEGQEFALVGTGSIRNSAEMIGNQLGKLPWSFWNLAEQKIAEDLDLPPERVHFISQPNIHLDLGIRPLNYPDVLVNDSVLSHKVLDRALASARHRGDQEAVSKLTCFKAATMESTSFTVSVCEALRSLNLRPIKAPLIFGNKCDLEVNYANAIIHQRPDQTLTMVTMESSLPDLNREVKAELHQLAPQIQRIRQVSGGPASPEQVKAITEKQRYAQYPFPGINYLEYLSNEWGSVHCLSLEHPAN